MTQDFSEIFAKYEALVADVDNVFKRVQEAHPECVTCEKGCSDCCYAVFDLSLVEAMYLNHRFGQKFSFGPERSVIVERADETDRKLVKLKRQAHRDVQNGRDAEEILQDMGRVRVRCPLLGETDGCELYEYRPITCRLYGIPTAIGGKAHSCGKSAFLAGKQYPTVNIDRIHERLAQLSLEIRDAVHSRFSELHTVLVPVSMALLTTYDDAYLGAGATAKGNE
ncbi:protein of unknown function UPF0153 [Oleidesulfovibrio alaskensis G20]|jgi:Fe-S-cluster containining protein|uniref:YkgJ family cysteine cluster protein n=1 Tax=Oleidesulfovibrio alaskensis (strain ATCC BAA-1058 / DSM 17464 / G20) TaxID=207559 RepID=Q30UT0_OLEA2|nr:YkgJ family cysteine cluster protein [Oleidesulfovibrio alaskensis]ABB40566.1 protein of unknown function UPF0153 [Oleidesulfovibrio alaskensis G20]MBG0774722.1 YkgJ family cysteine cluster protein [Oleidesulfovibrio alaskensis]MBL3583446.1 YkgJ family cysteine cluster protein [Oleidesulfovibrio alaskensis]